MIHPWEDQRMAANGRPVHENFKAWFGRSPLVDSRGRPLTVYHGTDRDFDAFDKGCIGDKFRADERGFFFLSDPKMASFYAETDTVGMNRCENGLVMPVYVALRKPLVVDDARLRREGMRPIGVNDDVISFWDTYQSLVLEWADDVRADGVVLVDKTYAPTGEPTKMVVAFEPYQVKSALGNSGLFLPGVADLSDRRAALSLEAALKARDEVPRQDARTLTP